MDDNERLEAIARKLGEQAERRVDPDRVVDHVLRRLRSEPVHGTPRSGVRRHTWVRVAAAAAIVAAAGIGVRAHLDGRAVDAGAMAVPDGLSELATAELTEVMDSLVVEAPVAESVGGLEALTEEQLELLLQRLEG